MRRTELFCETLRENPSDSEVAGNQLLLRGSYIQPLAAGIYSFLPLGERLRAKVETILAEEMESIGGQRISLPVVHPAEIWQETGRWYDVGPELVRFKDRNDRSLVLAMTHEEVIADMLRKSVRSYRQLPVMLYQIQTKFRDEPRARGGLLRVREFVMKDAYSCHRSFDDLDLYYPQVYQAYLNSFRRAGLEVIVVQSDVGMMGGSMAHEFMYLTDIGEDQLVLCDACGYAANRQVATFLKDDPPAEAELPLERVETPAAESIAALCGLLDIPASRTAKAAFFVAGERLIFAVVRGDMEVNETKLANVLKVSELRPARSEDLEASGIVAGYASPIGITGVTIVVDDLIPRSPNLVGGANQEGFHLRNTNVPRDYRAEITADIAAAFDGAPCAVCGGRLRIVRGVEVGNTFKLGTRYSAAVGATFLDEDGTAKDIVMGSYGIGVGRLIACVAQQCRDARGLVWPISVAPYQVYLVGLDLDDPGVRERVDRLYSALVDSRIEVLYDDRRERAGVKFNDADLLGMPLRVTVSRRTVAAQQAELTLRSSLETRHVPLERAVSEVRAEIEAMRVTRAAEPKA